ncbi:hypothetical protein BBP40_011912 [Aspergillus hancockii]|nr:hypothetical protein BBP40_011912 [Aspergillus hancockii]
MTRSDWARGFVGNVEEHYPTAGTDARLVPRILRQIPHSGDRGDSNGASVITKTGIAIPLLSSIFLVRICVTTDPQRPGVPGVREWLEAAEKPNGNSGASRIDRPSKESEYSQNDHSPIQQSPPQPHQQPQGTSPSTEGNTADEKPDEPSPVRHPFETSLNIEHGTNRVKVLGGSSSQCLAKSLDVYFEAARLKPVSASFQHGMRHAEELDMLLVLSLPALPVRDRRDKYASTYLERIHPIYPIFSPRAFQESIERLAMISDYRKLPRDSIPALVLVYLVMGLGSDEASQSVTEDGERYLHASAGLLSHIVTIPYLPAVQALLLLTLMYRGRNQGGLAWQVLGMAIRIAYTLGIHWPRNGSSLPTSNAPAEEKHLPTRVWTVCCCLERTMQLACGRPSSISAEHLNPVGSLTCESPYLQWHLGLAEYQGSISQHIYNYQAGSRSVRQILLDTARLDRLLLSWANLIPPELRPGNDIFCPEAEFHMVAYLSIQYHETLIALHRAALIAPTSSFDAEVERHCSEEPSKFRLRNGESICVNSARAIAKLSIELSERGAASRLIPVGSALLACIVLAIYLMKSSGSRLLAMDLELLKACLENASAQFARCLVAMYDQIVTYIRQLPTSEERRRTLEITQASQYVELKASAWSSRNDNSQSSSSDSTIFHNTPKYPIPHNFLNPATYDNSAPDMSNLGPAYTSDSVEAISYTSEHPQRASSGPIPAREKNPHQHQQIHAILHDTTSLIDQLATSGEATNEVDRLFPFEGYNVEDLWNWMLYFDGPQST